MNEADKRREARRKRILENSEIRLNKITTLNTNDIVLNEQLLLTEDINISKTELPDWPIPISHVTPTTYMDQNVFNYEPIQPSPKIHSKNIKYFKVKISYTTMLYIILSQLVLVLLYNDLGFLFGNSAVIIFVLSAIPELYTSNEQHDSIHIIILLMLGFSQSIAKQISRCTKLASVIGKQFCIYIFFFTCSYTLLTNLYLDVKHEKIR